MEYKIGDRVKIMTMKGIALCGAPEKEFSKGKIVRIEFVYDNLEDIKYQLISKLGFVAVSDGLGIEKVEEA